MGQRQKEKAQMSFQPTLDRVLVRPIEAARTTAGGILLPDNSQQKLVQGEVVNVGFGTYQLGELVPVLLDAGDIVTYVRGSGVEVVSGTEKLLLLREGDILGYESEEVVED